MTIIKEYRCDICGDIFDSAKDARKYERQHKKADEAFRQNHKPKFDMWDVVRQTGSKHLLLVIRAFTNIEDKNPQWWYAVLNLTSSSPEIFNTPERLLTKVASGEQLIGLCGKLAAELKPLKMSVAEFASFCKEHGD